MRDLGISEIRKAGADSCFSLLLRLVSILLRKLLEMKRELGLIFVPLALTRLCLTGTDATAAPDNDSINNDAQTITSCIVK